MRPPVTGTRAGTTSASDAEAQYAEALAVAQQGDPVRARALLERLYLRCRTHVGVRNALGVLRLEAGDAGGAIALLKPLASELPRAAPVWLNLGNAMVAAGRAADAVAPLTRATKLQPADDLAWYGLGRALQIAGRVEESVAAYSRALQVNPPHRLARANLVAAYNCLEQYAMAEEEARAVLAVAPDDAGTHFNLSVSLLARGAWTAGWAEYEWRERTEVLTHQRRTAVTPRWNGATLEGQTILVNAEQGYGDTVQFARYLPLLSARGAQVVLQCPAPLVALLRASALADQVIAFGDPVPAHDVHVPLTGLPHRLGLHDHAALMGVGAPYLTPPSERTLPDLAWTGTTAPRVGLVWAGSATHVNDMHRSCGLAALEALWTMPGVTWVSLQAGKSVGEGGVKAPKGVVLHDHAAHLTDFADTAVALRALDLVITVDSAVAHLAGALGIPCWVLLPRIGLDWRWAAETPDARWYASVRTFRQHATGGWRATLREVRTALEGVWGETERPAA
jgi:tetratricopeptide (TPR) repeat protein